MDWENSNTLDNGAQPANPWEKEYNPIEQYQVAYSIP